MAVEIIGRACHVAEAASPEELFQLLRDGRSTISEIPDDRWDKARYWHPQVGVPGKTYTYAAGVISDMLDFDPAVFGISPRETESLDPQQRLLLRMTWRALEDANLTAGALRAERVGVYVGASNLEYGNLIVGDPAAASPYFMTGNTLSVVSNRISHVLGVQGPSMTIDTACSSGLVALDLAVRALEDGDIETAIVGSVNILAHPLSFVGFAQARMLSPLGQCRAYDNDAEGYVRAEGGAVFILRRSDRAVASGDRSHARILASGVNSAGHTNGISLPSREAQAALLDSIYAGRGIDVGHLAFVEGHGTGTRVGDPAEIWALGTAIGQKRRAALPVGSIKSNIGHTEPASGLLGLMKATLALEYNCLPASLHFDTPNADIDFVGLNVSVAANPIELLPSKRPRLAGVNSFGFGGTNVHVVISDPEMPDRSRPRQDGETLFLTAQSTAGLRNLLTAYRSRLNKTSRTELPHLLASTGANRQHMRHRFALHARDPKSIVREIDGFLDGKPGPAAETGSAVRDQADTVFVFCGNGSQWAGMALDAYQQNASFRERFKVVDALFRSTAGIDLRELMNDPELEAKLADTRVAQPLLFATQVALADSLVELGLFPSATYGHSIGEVAAAYVAGAISLVDAVTIVAKRSHHQHRLAGAGKMAAVAMGSAEAVAMARAAGLTNIHAAASNAHNSATVSGPADEIEQFFALAGSKRVAAQILDIDYPFHHPMIDMARQDFLKDLSPPALRATRIPFISSVTGDVLDGEALTPTYWWRNIREPVRFDAATGAALRAGARVFLEIGPRPILLSYLRDTIRLHDLGGVAAPTLVKGSRTECDPVRKAFGRALTIGAAFDIERALGRRDAFTSLPPLPFDSTSLRYPRTPEALDLYGDGCRDVHTLIGWRVDMSGNVWHNHIDAHLHPDLAEHVVDGRSILPGSAFLDMILAAARRHHVNAPFEITNLEILHPMDLSQSRLHELATVISPETGRIEIKSRERLKDEDWTLHAVARSRGSVIPVDWTVPEGAPDAETIGASEVYRTAERFLLDYGPSFRLLDRITRRGPRYLEVELKPACAPAHPYLTHELNPMSTDAAFHGLVGLFREFALDADIAPYIPVHFGLIQLHQPGASVRRAAIAIEKVSAYSLKANIRLLDEAGLPVATLTDCRLRRTRLKPQKSLDAQTYHYETITSDVRSMPKSREQAHPVLLPEVWPANAAAESAQTEASLILEAAVYRACFDVTSRWSNADGRLSESGFTGDASLHSFISSCLFRLEDAGLARLVDQGWQLAECTLPSFSDLLTQFIREDAGRSVEAVLLNDAYSMALERTARRGLAPTEDVARGHGEMSDTTLDYALTHSPAIQLRQNVAVEAIRQAIEARADGGRRPRHVVQLYAASKSASLRLAEIAGLARARLTIVESNDRLRKELELAFQDVAHVEVAAGVDPALGADIVVSISENLYPALELDGAERSFVRAALEGGGAFVGCFDLPNPFSDFVIGQRDGWFGRTMDPSYPIGKLATVEDWHRLADQFGTSDSRMSVINSPAGKAVAIGWAGRTEPTPAVVAATTAPCVVIGAESDKVGSEAMGAAISWIGLSGIAAEGRSEIAAALQKSPRSAAFVFVPDRFGEAEGSDALGANVGVLAILVKELAAQAIAGLRPALAVILPDGAPLGQSSETVDALVAARNSGIWAFLRVVRNEYPDIDIHSVDLAGCARPLAAQMRLAAALCETPSRNREWTWDADAEEYCEVRAVPGSAPRSKRTTRDFTAATLRQGAMSNISTLEWTASKPRALAPGEVRIKVAATALNYRDVMWSIGLLPEEALEDGFAGPSIGMECSGMIVEIADDVGNLAVGDPVMAVAPKAFSTHVVTSAQAAVRLPDGIATVAGATLPVAFLTAYYALVELGNLREGETVLVHGGAGGVGLAALQVAKAFGAKVIATASTIEKRRLLTTFGADHVLDSRSMEFAGQIKRLTDQAGVDVVLNSLFGDAMERGISVLKPFGRFLELGKRDYYLDTKIGLRPFRRNISYFGIDADQLLKSRPDMTARLFSEIAELFSDGKLHPIPYRAFPDSEIRDAFRLMQGSGHIGKIVVTPPVAGRDAVARASVRTGALSADGTYLVVGGTGGFGVAAAEWLVERGARSIALCSRRAMLDSKASAALARWSETGVDATVHACDVTNEADLAGLLAELRAKRPLRGVLHAAMHLDDALLVNLDRERMQPVIDVKARGAQLLDRLTRDDDLDEFILFSSVTTLIGNPGQANYVAGNGFLEGLARTRRQLGLPALAIGFGAISDAGHLVQNEAARAVLAKRLGKFSLTAREALEKLREYIVSDPGTVAAASVVIADMNLHAARSLDIVSSPLFSVLARSLSNQPSGMTGDGLDLAALIEGKSASEGEQAIFEIVASEFAAALRVPTSEITRTRTVREIGIDSLLAMELGMNFQQKTGTDLPLSNLSEATTIGDISHKLYLRVSGATEAPPAPDSNRALVEQLVGRHSEEPGVRSVNE